MRKIVGFLVLIGVGLLGVGLWWLLSGRPENLLSPTTTLNQTQEIGLERSALSGQVLVNTPEGLQGLVVETGELKPLGGSFDKLKEQVISFTQSADDAYWLLQTRVEETSADQSIPTINYQLYLVDWQQNKLQRLTETLATWEKYEKMQLTSIAWVGPSTVGLAFAAAPTQTDPENAETAATATGEVPAQTFDLALFDLKTLQLVEVGSLQADSLTVLGGEQATAKLYLRVHNQGTEQIISRSLGSNQPTTLLADLTNYVYSYNTQQAQAVLATATGFEVTTFTDLSKTTELPSTNGYSLEPSAWWASTGAVVAVVERTVSDEVDTVQKILEFYSDTGTLLYSLPLENTGNLDSLSVQLSFDGTMAVATRDISTTANSSQEEQAARIYYYIDVFAGTDQVISNIPLSAQVLGVL